MSYLRVSGTDKSGMSTSPGSSSSSSYVDTGIKIGDKVVDWYQTVTGGSRRAPEPPPSSGKLPGGDFLSQPIAGIPLWMILAGVGGVILLKRRKG